MSLLLSLIGHVAQSKGGKYALLLAERGYFDLGADQTLQRVAGRAMREVNTVSKEKTDGDGLRGSGGVRDNGSPVQDNGTRCRWKGSVVVNSDCTGRVACISRQGTRTHRLSVDTTALSGQQRGGGDRVQPTPVKGSTGPDHASAKIQGSQWPVGCRRRTGFFLVGLTLTLVCEWKEKKRTCKLEFVRVAEPQRSASTKSGFTGECWQQHRHCRRRDCGRCGQVQRHNGWW